MRDLGQQPTTWMGTGCCATDANQQRSQPCYEKNSHPPRNGEKTAGDSTFMPSHVRTAATAALGAAIVGPAVTHVIFSDFERYRAPEATTATFVAGEGHESLCWLPRGRRCSQQESLL